MSQTSPASDPSTSGEPEDEIKRRFREALERKQANARDGAQHETGNGKNQHAHGRAGGKRTFRRKSG